MIDGDKNVLSCNDGGHFPCCKPTPPPTTSATACMGLVPGSGIHADAVNQAVHDQKASEIVLEVGGLYLRVYVSPAEGVPGAMILIVDASAHIRAEQQRKRLFRQRVPRAENAL